VHFRNDARRLAIAREHLKQSYELYINTHSGAEGMAISLECAALIWVMCDLLKPTNILDLGSGYSSYVFRTWAQDRSIPVTSIDTDAEYLALTQKFCGTLSGFKLWEEFLVELPQKFDFVLYDLGRMDVRYDNCTLAFDFLTYGGAIIIDDMHKLALAEKIEKIVDEQKMITLDVKEASLDKFGRYCALAIR